MTGSSRRQRSSALGQRLAKRHFFPGLIGDVISPVRMVRQFKIEQHDGWQYDETLAEAPYEKQLLEAQAFYQRANIDFSK